MSGSTGPRTAGRRPGNGSGGSQESTGGTTPTCSRRGGAYGLERRPPVGSCDCAAHGGALTCGMVLSRGATGPRRCSRISVARGEQRRVARGPSARCADRRSAFPAVSAIFMTSGVCRRTRSWAFLPVGASHRHRGQRPRNSRRHRAPSRGPATRMAKRCSPAPATAPFAWRRRNVAKRRREFRPLRGRCRSEDRRSLPSPSSGGTAFFTATGAPRTSQLHLAFKTRPAGVSTGKPHQSREGSSGGRRLLVWPT